MKRSHVETHHWWSRQHFFRHVAEYAHRKALDSLEKEGLLQDPLLKEALKKLHGYASQPGIRHGRQEGSTVNVGLDEAMVMYGVCGSFAAYLAQKCQGKQKAMDAVGTSQADPQHAPDSHAPEGFQSEDSHSSRAARLFKSQH